MRARRIAALAAAAGIALSLAVSAVPGGPAAAAELDLHPSAKTKITKGVLRWSISWRNKHGEQRGYVMSVDLTVAGLALRPGLGHGMLNNREVTSGIADRGGAVAAVNGDLFDWTTSLPWGGVAIGGTVLKTPIPGRTSQFYVTSDGKAGIGPLNWTGAITPVSASGRLGTTHRFAAVNAPGAADAGRLTLFTPAMTGERLTGCAAVSGSISGSTLTVRRVVTHLRHFDRLAAGHRMLAGCGSAGEWLLRNAPLHQRLRLSQRLTTPSGAHVSSFISGERTLRMGGKAYRDADGFHTAGINPETAACVSHDRQHVLLIVVDGWLGWLGGGNGITLYELGQLAAALNCYSTVVFDGGGSSTMVERRSGELHVDNQVPTRYGQRPVSDALLVVKS